MDFNNIKIEQLVEYVNIELNKHKNMSVNKLCDFIGVKRSTLKSRITKSGYSYNADKRIYEITSNITPKEPSKQAVQEVKTVATVENIVKTIEPVTEPFRGVESSDKLNLLLDNLDNLLALVERCNITSNMDVESKYRSGKNDVKSLRLDTGLYEEVKLRATTNNITIGDIINKSIEDYLKNYI